MSNNKTIAIYFHKNNIGIISKIKGLSVFNENSIRIQCSEIRSVCCLAFPKIISLIHQCNNILSNNFLHQLFSTIDLEQFKISTISQKSLEEEVIFHRLMTMSSHISEATNIKAFINKFRKSKTKFTSLGMVLNSIVHQKVYIEDIDFFVDTLFQSVQWTNTELQFLEITKEDLHPSLIKGTGNSKEGYSIISAYEAFMASTGSKRVLRYLLLNPTYDRQILESRFEIIDWMKIHLKENKYMKYFKSIHVMQTILKKFSRMNVEEEQWRKLIKSLEAMLEIRSLLNLQEVPQLIADYINDPNWLELIELLNAFKATLQLSPLGIKNGIDYTLDHLKKVYDNMPHLLTLIAKEQQWELDFRIVFMAQIGYLIKVSLQTQVPETLGENQWTLQFSNNSGKFYSNTLTQALDNQYGDLYGEIQDIQKKILFDMEAQVVERQAILLKLYWKVCEIECFWGISQLSKNMSRPRLSSEALIVSNGWHPLLTGDVIHNHSFSFPQSQAPKQSIYNSEQNLVNTNYSNRCMVITGPNASGKTVYMKQLGIIVYLTHCGLFVPGNLAQIPLIDSLIFVGKTESIYNNQKCGFESELESLSSIAMNLVSSKSFIMIDELGSEIDYQNSLKLLSTTIEYITNENSPFLQNRILSKRHDEFKTPLVIIVTHLSEILRSNVLEENYLTRFLTMQVQAAGLRLFKIKPGLVKKGYGIKTASEILPESIIALSRYYLKLISQL